MQVAVTSCFTQRVQLFSVAPLTETVALYSCGFSNYFTQRVYLLNPPVIMKFLPFIAGGFYQLFYTKSVYLLNPPVLMKFLSFMQVAFISYFTLSLVIFSIHPLQ